MEEIEEIQQSPALQVLKIVYDPISSRVGVVENDFKVFSALGVLEAVKAMITNNWLNGEEE